MIFINVNSEAMQVKKQFETDAAAEKFLHWVKKWHDMVRVKKAGTPPRKNFHSFKDRIDWENNFKTCLPLRVDILNTDASQLNLINELKK